MVRKSLGIVSGTPQLKPFSLDKESAPGLGNKMYVASEFIVLEHSYIFASCNLCRIK